MISDCVTPSLNFNVTALSLGHREERRDDFRPKKSSVFRCFCHHRQSLLQSSPEHGYDQEVHRVARSRRKRTPAWSSLRLRARSGGH